LRGNHLAPREPGFFKQPLQRDLGQIRNKKIQAPELGPELPYREIQPVDIRHRCDLNSTPWESFFVSAAGQPSKPLFFENQGNGNRAYPLPTLLQDPADIIDGEILFTQGNDLLAKGLGFPRSLGPFLRGKEEGAIGMLAKLRGEDAKASRGIPEATGDFGRSKTLDEIGPEGFVLPVSGISGLEKIAGHIC